LASPYPYLVAVLSRVMKNRQTRYFGQPTSLPGCCSFSGHAESSRPGILASPHPYLVAVLSRVMQNRRGQVFWPAHIPTWSLFFLRVMQNRRDRYFGQPTFLPGRGVMQNRRDQVFWPAHIPTWSRGHAESKRPGNLASPNPYLVADLSCVMNNRRGQVFWPAHIPT
jgi:hypothetical protein